MEISESDNGRLVLHSSQLEEIHSEYKPSDVPVVGRAIDVVSRCMYGSKDMKVKCLIAKHLSASLEDRMSAAGSDDEKEQLKRVKQAFELYHDIRINHLSVNNQDTVRYGFLMRNRTSLLSFGLLLTNYLIFDISEIPSYILCPAVVGAGLFFVKKNVQQKLDKPVFNIDEIRDDIVDLSGKYEHHKNKYFAAKKHDKDSETGQYEPEKISDMKKTADHFIQRYCPTLDLESVTVVAEDTLNLVNGRVSDDTVKISKAHLSRDMNNFYRVYFHEIAHIDGVFLESIAEYDSVKVFFDIQQESSDHYFKYEFHRIMLLAAVHTYITERKRSIMGMMYGFYHLADTLHYNYKWFRNLFSGRKLPKYLSMGVNSVICDELAELGVKEDTIREVYGYYETPYLTKQLLFLLQYILNSNEFKGGYTRQLYHLMKTDDRFKI